MKIDINEYLVKAISKYSVFGKKITKKVAEELTGEFFYKEKKSDLTIKEIRDILIKEFDILEEDKDSYVVLVKSGLLNMNPAIVVLSKNDNKICLAGYAKEGLIKQNTAKQSVNKVYAVLK